MKVIQTPLAKLEASSDGRGDPRVLVYEVSVDCAEDEERAFVQRMLGNNLGAALVVRLNRFAADGKPVLRLVPGASQPAPQPSPLGT